MGNVIKAGICLLGIHMNLEKVFLKNKAKKNVLRKQTFIINTGDNITRAERKVKIAENKKLVYLILIIDISMGCLKKRLTKLNSLNFKFQIRPPT